MTPQQPGQQYNQYNQPPNNQPPFNQGFQPPFAPSKGLAIGALVCGFLFPIGGIILGIIALYLASKKPREYGGKGLAVGGIAAGGLMTAVTVVILVFTVILAVQEADKQTQTTRTVSSDTTPSRPPTAYSLAATIPGGWTTSGGAKYAFMKDGKFASTNSKGAIAAYGSYTVADNQTVKLQITQDGQTGTGTMKISVVNNDTITMLEGGTTSTLTRVSYDK